VTGYTFSQIGPAAKLCFSTERSGKRIQWSQTKRLQPGTIVALTPAKDMFKTTCKIAVVAARPVSCVDKDPSEIDIFWANPGDAEIDATVEYVMVESRTGYFEAYRHILVALQKLMMER
jgi:helicase required for RNAi-mediated heterochromatin assembly 1